jgi:hypothetical protein
MQRYTVYLYMETALHVLGGTSTHHQERIQLYLQHLVFVTPLLLGSLQLLTAETLFQSWGSVRRICGRQVFFSQYFCMSLSTMIPTIIHVHVHSPVVPCSLDTDTVAKVLKEVFFL